MWHESSTSSGIVLGAGDEAAAVLVGGLLVVGVGAGGDGPVAGEGDGLAVVDRVVVGLGAGAVEDHVEVVAGAAAALGDLADRLAALDAAAFGVTLDVEEGEAVAGA